MGNGLSKPFGGNGGDDTQPSGAAAEDTASSLPPGMSAEDVAEEREQARALLADERLMAALPAEGQIRLEGLLEDDPTSEEIEQGGMMVMLVSAIQEAARMTAFMTALLDRLPEPVRAWYNTREWAPSRRWLAHHLADLPENAPDLLESAAARIRTQGGEHRADTLQLHAILLREARRSGVGAAYLAIIGDRAFAEPGKDDYYDDDGSISNALRALLETLEAWIDTPDWNASRIYLKSHAETLLTDEVEAVLAQRGLAQDDDDARRMIAEHADMLREARANGIDDAYDTFLRDHLAGAGDAPIADVEINVLVRELAAQRLYRDPARVEALCRQILALDDERHALNPRLRDAISHILGDCMIDRIFR